MKSYTDIEQSKKLAEILSFESADMFYPTNCDWEGKIIGLLDVPLYIGSDDFVDTEMGDIYAWSLEALLDALPKDIIVLGTIYSINIYTKNKKWFIGYKCNNEELIGSYSNIFINACYELIIKLHEQNIL